MSNQNCNISHSGGSYLFSPVRGPLNGTKTPGTIENNNNGVSYAKNGQPFKTNTCDSGGSHAIQRRLYRDKTDDTSVMKENGDLHIASSSMVTDNNKINAVGKSVTNEEGSALSFKSVNINDEKSARSRNRKSGYVVSKKFRTKNLPPPSVTRRIFKDKQYASTSLKSHDLRISAFTPLHLIQRIRCSDNCDTKSLEIDYYTNENDGDFQCLYSRNYK